MSLNNSYNYSELEIKKIIKGIDKKHHLEVYKILKNSNLAPNISKKDLQRIEDDIKKLFSNKDIPRLLTDKELDDIISIIPATPATFDEISKHNQEQIKETLRRQLSIHKITVSEESINDMKKDILEKFYKSQVAPGESVGTNAAVSIGQRMTQDTLNTFHTVGAKNTVGEGVNSIDKLFNISSKGPKTATIHFKDKNKTKEEITQLERSFRGVNVAMLVKNKKIMTKIKPEDKVWYDDYHNIMNVDYSLEDEDKFLRVYFNTFKCFKYEITIMDIVKTIEKNTKTAGIKQTVKCVASDSYTGIIDIYVSKDFVRRKYEEVAKVKSSQSGNIDELVSVFLESLLINKFEEMFIKGIQNVQGFNVSPALPITSIFNDIEIDNAKDLEKFSSEPYNLEMQDIIFLWRIRIEKYHILFTGLNEEKFINLFTSVGLKIIENNFDSKTPNFVVLMPEERDVYFWSDEENEIKRRYEKLENGKYKDLETGKISNYFGPKKLIEQKLKFIEESLFREITDILINDRDPIFPDVPDLYRYAYYYHAVIDDGDIISDLFNNKLIDPQFTYPNDINRINELFGIEAARFYLASKYNSLSVLEKVNPINVELLINFQTAYGILISVTSSGLAKQGCTILTSAAFQDMMTFLEKGAAFGTRDNIIGISSSIMTGSMCKNGTGMVNVDYDEKYLNDEGNKFKENETAQMQFNVNDFTGPCYMYSGKIDDIKNDKTILNEDSVIENTDKTARYTGIKERVPSPPRMQKSSIFEDEEFLDIATLEEQEEQVVSEDFSLNLDIPDAPELGSYEVDDFF